MREWALWVPNWSSTLCDLGVFVYQPADQIATSEMKVGMAMSQVTAMDELFGTHTRSTSRPADYLFNPRANPSSMTFRASSAPPHPSTVTSWSSRSL